MPEAVNNDPRGDDPIADGEVASAYTPRRLATPLPITIEQVPSWESIGLEPTIDEALHWFRLRNSLLFTEALAATAPHQRDRWTELAGLAGSMAEVVSVAAATEVEVQLLADGLAGRELPPPLGICRRGFGEAQGYFVISAAHKLANWCARGLMLARGYPWGWAGEPKALLHPFDVFSDDRANWLAAPQGLAVATIASRCDDPATAAMGRGLSEFLESSSWLRLYKQRHEDFHKWRYESPYASGVNKTSQWVDDLGSRTRTMNFGAYRYTEGVGVVEEICELAAHGLRRISSAMASVRGAFEDAMPYLSGQAITFNRRPDGSLTRVTRFGEP